MLCRQCAQLALPFKELVRSLQVLHSLPHRSFSTDTDASDASAPSSSDSSPGGSAADFFRKVAALQGSQSRSSGTAWLTTADKAQHQDDDSVTSRSNRNAAPNTASPPSDGAKGSSGLVHPQYGYAVLGGVDPATSQQVAGAQQPKLHPTNNFKIGDTYNPVDLSPLAGEQDEAWVPRRRNRAPEQLLGLSEVKEKLDYKNIDFLLNFVSASGRIKARRRTRLPPRLQSRVSRTIKLARQMALIPYETRVGDGGEGDTWRRLRAFNKAVQ